MTEAGVQHLVRAVRTRFLRTSPSFRVVRPLLGIVTTGATAGTDADASKGVDPTGEPDLEMGADLRERR